MEQKGRARHRFGSQNGRAKMTEDDIRAIRNDPRTQMEIAEDYGISQPQVGNIKRRIQWGHVPD